MCGLPASARDCPPRSTPVIEPLLLGDVDNKTSAARCERVDRERCVINRATMEPALAGGGKGRDGYRWVGCRPKLASAGLSP